MPRPHPLLVRGCGLVTRLRQVALFPRKITCAVVTGVGSKVCAGVGLLEETPFLFFI